MWHLAIFPRVSKIEGHLLVSDDDGIHARLLITTIWNFLKSPCMYSNLYSKFLQFFVSESQTRRTDRRSRAIHHVAWYREGSQQTPKSAFCRKMYELQVTLSQASNANTKQTWFAMVDNENWSFPEFRWRKHNAMKSYCTVNGSDYSLLTSMVSDTGCSRQPKCIGLYMYKRASHWSCNPMSTWHSTE